MTTHIKIENVNDGGGRDVVVNEVETSTPREHGRTVETHWLKPGDSVVVNVSGWRRYVNVLEGDDVDSILSMTDEEIIAQVGGPEEVAKIAAKGREIFDRAIAQVDASSDRKGTSST
jgi:hypothetical protein